MIYKVSYRRVDSIVIAITYQAEKLAWNPNLTRWQKVFGSERIIQDPAELREVLGKER